MTSGWSPDWSSDAAILAVALGGLGCSALCSGLETGLYTLNRVRLTVAAARGDRRAIRVQHELAQPERILASLLIGNNVVNYVGTLAIATLLDRAELGPVASVVVNTLVVVPVLLVFGEVLPKDLFRTFTDRWTYRLSALLVGLRRMLSWMGLLALVRGVAGLVTRWFGGERPSGPSARQKVAHLLQEGARTGVLSGEQLSLVDRALEMRRRTVAGEMVPWSRAITLRLEASADERSKVIRERPFSRLPVVDAQGRVRGVLQAIDAILQKDRPTADLLRPIEFLPAEMPAAEAIRRLRQSRQRFAVVGRPDARPIGIVALKDLIEPLTGDLRAW